MATPRSASGVTDGNRLLARPWLPGVELFHADFSGQAFGRHSHDAFAIGAILHGVGGYQCRGARHALPAGTLSLMNPQEPHTGHAESPRLIYRMLYIEEARLPALLGRKQLPRGFRQLNPADDGAVAAGLAQLAVDFQHGDALGLESRLLQLLELVSQQALLVLPVQKLELVVQQQVPIQVLVFSQELHSRLLLLHLPHMTFHLQ